MGQKYNPEDDKILWESEPIQFKPKATLKVQVKSYKGSVPKIILVEEGEGFGGKQYSGYILKRVELDGLAQVEDLLRHGRDPLEKLTLEWRMKKGQLSG